MGLDSRFECDEMLLNPNHTSKGLQMLLENKLFKYFVVKVSIALLPVQPTQLQVNLTGLTCILRCNVQIKFKQNPQTSTHI